MALVTIPNRRERAERVCEWADMHGDDLPGALRLDEDDEHDAETLSAFHNALLCAGAVLDLLPEHERGARG